MIDIRHTRHLGRALTLVWQSGPGWAVARISLLMIEGALPLLSLYLAKLVVDAVASGLLAEDVSDSFGRVAVLIGLGAATTLTGALARSVSGLVGETQAQLVTDHLHDVLHAKSVAVDLAYYESAQYYDTLHRAQQEGSWRPLHILNGLVQVGQNVISLLAMAGLLLSFHWGIAALLSIAIIPEVLVRTRFAERMYHWQRKRTATERQTWYLDWVLTGDRHAKEVRLYDLGALFIQRFRDLRRQIRREKLEIATRRTLAELATQAIATLAVAASYAWIAYRTVYGVVTLGSLVMYYQAFQRGQAFFREMLGGLAGLYEDTLFLSNLYEFLELEPKLVEPSRPKPIPHPMQTGIVFDRVSFQYPAGTRPVLVDVTLSIQPGEHIALVGRNGSGKTTLIKLLCRLYDPTAGRITLDGTDLRHFATASLRREIGVIFQDYAQFQLTARENVWLGNIDLPPDHERITAAARYAGADEVISRLPSGYETVLGNWFEDGKELSVGEWQKVALARAFLRDAPILVLDEPTSALDARAEYQVFERFHQLAAGRTAILISHRFSTVRLADRIYVLDGGKIVESGSHGELLELKGRYARMFETQAQYYR